MAMVRLCRPVAMVFVLAATSAALPGQPAASADADKKLLEQAAALSRLLDELIDTEPFQKEQPFEAFLKALEDRLPNDKKTKIRIDQKAFGGELDNFAKTPVRMPTYPKKLSVHAILKFALARIADPDAYLDVLPTHVSITTRAHAALYSVEHEIGDLVKQARRHHAIVRTSWRSFGPEFDVHDIDPGDGVALLIRLITAQAQPGNTLASMRVRNQSKLELRGTAQEHFRVGSIFAALRRIIDVAVVMHARLIEVDRAWHDEHIAPVLAGKNRGPEAFSAVPVDLALAKKLKEQRIIVQGHQSKLAAEEKAVFLSWQRPFSFVDKSAIFGGPRTRRTGVEGVVFHVEATVSADRCSMHLKISQDVAQLIGIEKKRLPVIGDDKEADYESPTIRRSGVASEIELEDGTTFVMPVAYRPADDKNAERRWLLLAEPMIWIEEEQRLIEMGELAPMK
jgi:hypothetical protein